MPVEVSPSHLNSKPPLCDRCRRRISWSFPPSLFFPPPRIFIVFPFTLDSSVAGALQGRSFVSDRRPCPFRCLQFFRFPLLLLYGSIRLAADRCCPGHATSKVPLKSSPSFEGFLIPRLYHAADLSKLCGHFSTLGSPLIMKCLFCRYRC